MAFDPGMSDQQKLDYLEKWCGNLTEAVKQLRAEAQHFHERLRQVESEIGPKSA